MSGGSAGGGGLGCGWPPFTAAQWQELEHQALIFKYIKAGLLVPPDLLAPIHRSLESISARLLHYPTLGYYSIYVKTINRELGRCRRTDGKKWRCSKDAHPDSKYCERHMNRGRYRSRKPVESQTTTSPKPTVDVGTGTSSATSGRIFQNLPTHSGSVNLSFGSHSPQLQMETSPYGSSNKYSELKPRADMSKSSVQSSTNVKSLDLKSMVVDFNQPGACGAPADIHGVYASSEKQQKQHYFFGMEFNSHGNLKQEQQLVQPLFDEWPEARASRSFLDCQRSNLNSFSSTQLSMGIDNESEPPHSTQGNMCNFTA